MSLLSERLKTAIAETKGETGKFDLSRAGKIVLQAMDEEEVQDCALRYIISKAGRFTRQHKVGSEPRFSQVETLFPELDQAYPLGDDGAVTKATEELTYEEFRSVVRLRQEQVAHDQNRLAFHRNVLRLAEPIWRANPHWVFGEVCRALDDPARKVA